VAPTGITLAGQSLGGLAAAYGAPGHPDLFSGVVTSSMSAGWGDGEGIRRATGSTRVGTTWPAGVAGSPTGWSRYSVGDVVAPARDAGATVVVFDSEWWLWDARRADTWTFVNLPADASEEIRELAAGPRRGLGSVRVRVSIGGSTWRTSIFPDSAGGGYVRPVKGPLRQVELLCGRVLRQHPQVHALLGGPLLDGFRRAGQKPGAEPGPALVVDDMEVVQQA
jgi:pimeloyl-ACP methyl ester carboxylesterase